LNESEHGVASCPKRHSTKLAKFIEIVELETTSVGLGIVEDFSEIGLKAPSERYSMALVDFEPILAISFTK
jgi:hypothetical protein